MGCQLILLRVHIISLLILAVSSSLPDARPAYDDRTFHSSSVDSFISEKQPLFINEDLGTLFSNCLPNTLDTTVYSQSGRNDTFVITGDIEAMWLRDSTNQVLPYMKFAKDDQPLADMLCGLVRRQANSVLIDGYANAFNIADNNEGHQDDVRNPPMTGGVFEGKYELDSIAAFLKLSNEYLNATNDISCYDYSGTTLSSSQSVHDDDDLKGTTWFDAIDAALTVIETETRDTTQDAQAGWWYSFQRDTTVSTDTLNQGGRGPPSSFTGMSKSYFRPSDDGQTFPFLIPANAMAVVELVTLKQTLESLNQQGVGGSVGLSLAARALSLAEAMESGMWAYGVNDQNILAYEVDGYGGRYLMDDANVPSLLSLPFLGLLDLPNDRYDDSRADAYDWTSVYKNTRPTLLNTSSNPFYFSGSDGEGTGGPHVGYGYAWPMAVTMRALTSDDDDEITACLDLLVKSSAGTGLLHESFNVNDVSDYTRSWFAWANTLFGGLIIDLIDEKPYLILNE